MFEKIFKKKVGSNEFSDSMNPISDDDIRYFNEFTHVKIPQPIVALYMIYNGGTPEKSYFYSEVADIEITINTFLPIKYKNKTGYTMESMYLKFVSEKVFPAYYLPFAIDWGSNLICVNLNSGEIVVIWMDKGEITENEIKVLFKDFYKFMSALEYEE